jgi:hypothetical protein
MSRSIQLLLALALMLPVLAACTIDPTGPGSVSSALCGSARADDHSCQDVPATPVEPS